MQGLFLAYMTFSKNLCFSRVVVIVSYIYLCQKQYAKIACHLEQVHGHEEEVKTALKYEHESARSRITT